MLQLQTAPNCKPSAAGSPSDLCDQQETFSGYPRCTKKLEERYFMHYLLARFACREQLLAGENQFSAGSQIEISQRNPLTNNHGSNSVCFWGRIC